MLSSMKESILPGLQVMICMAQFPTPQDFVSLGAPRYYRFLFCNNNDWRNRIDAIKYLVIDE